MVLKELENGEKKDTGVWVHATLESGGEEKTKQLYLKYRILDVQDKIRRADLKVIMEAKKKSVIIKSFLFIFIIISFLLIIYFSRFIVIDRIKLIISRGGIF